MSAVIDDEFASLCVLKWHYLTVGYAASRHMGHYVTLHRSVMELADVPIDGLQVDHVNGNRLDCRLSNLRPATKRQNMQNRMKSPGRSSVFKGVTRVRGGWHAQIKHGGKNYHLGNFESERDAALAYDTEASRVFGEFARTNFGG
jgi:hypothetical protein